MAVVYEMSNDISIKSKPK